MSPGYLHFASFQLVNCVSPLGMPELEWTYWKVSSALLPAKHNFDSFSSSAKMFLFPDLQIDCKCQFTFLVLSILTSFWNFSNASVSVASWDRIFIRTPIFCLTSPQGPQWMRRLARDDEQIVMLLSYCDVSWTMMTPATSARQKPWAELIVFTWHHDTTQHGGNREAFYVINQVFPLCIVSLTVTHRLICRQILRLVIRTICG